GVLVSSSTARHRRDPTPARREASSTDQPSISRRARMRLPGVPTEGSCAGATIANVAARGLGPAEEGGRGAGSPRTRRAAPRARTFETHLKYERCIPYARGRAREPNVRTGTRRNG